MQIVFKNGYMDAGLIIGIMFITYAERVKRQTSNRHPSRRRH